MKEEEREEKNVDSILCVCANESGVHNQSQNIKMRAIQVVEGGTG